MGVRLQKQPWNFESCFVVFIASTGAVWGAAGPGGGEGASHQLGARASQTPQGACRRSSLKVKHLGWGGGALAFR